MDNAILIPCRLCAEYKPQNQQLTLDFNEVSCMKILNKLSRFNIELDLNKDLPRTVCRDCTQALDSAFKFVTLVEKAQTHFNQMLKEYDQQAIDESNSVAKKIEFLNPDIGILTEDGRIIKKETSTVSLEIANENSIEDENVSLKNESGNSDENFAYDVKIENMEKNHIAEENGAWNYDNVTLKDLITRNTKENLRNHIENCNNTPTISGIPGTSKKATEVVTVTAIIQKYKSNTKVPENIEMSTTNEALPSWKDYTWKCRFCETEFPTIAELSEHSVQYHSTCNPHKCLDCNRVTVDLDKFITHIKKHRNVLRNCCHKCNEHFPTTRILNLHNNQSHAPDVSLLKCMGCHRMFPSKDELDKHVNTFYKGNKYQDIVVDRNSLTCDKCQKAYTTVGTLKKHIFTQHSTNVLKKEHVCEVCGKCYYYKNDLTDHMRLHSDLRFQCEICKFCFPSIFRLRNHARLIHFNNKEYCCDYCGKYSKTRSCLISHLRIHTSPKSFHCTFCDKRFHSRTYLNIHLRQHTGDKPFSCDICKRTFTIAPNRNKHMLLMHGVENRKKKKTPQGFCVIDPNTGKAVIPPDDDKILEWKKDILKPLHKLRKINQ